MGGQGGSPPGGPNNFSTEGATFAYYTPVINTNLRVIWNISYNNCLNQEWNVVALEKEFKA